MNYFLYKNHYSIYDLAWEIGSFYFSNSFQKDNISLVCAIIQKVRNTQKTFEDTVLKLREIQFKNNFSNIKFFQTDDAIQKQSKVQIMTLHKSKGDEFDYVFIPEMAEKNLTLDFNQIKLKSSDFTENLKRLNPKYKHKTEFELKQELVSENLRLLYVAITRAKKYLYFTTSQKVKSFEKIIEQEPSLIFSELIQEVANV